MTKTKLMLAGLITGAMAFGVACKTDQMATHPPTTASSMDQQNMDQQNMGGSGDITQRNRDENMTPMPADGAREMEPEVHQDPLSPPPATGGSGLDPKPMDQTDRMAPETNMEPTNPESMPTPVH